jgi:hypothetical protein
VPLPRNPLPLAARPIQNGGVTSVSNGTFPIDIETTLASLKIATTRSRRRCRTAWRAPALFNRVNYLGVNTTWGTALAPRDTFGRFESAADPRQLQFGLKLEF